MKCDIIIPVWSQPDLTKDCIENIIKNTRYPYKLILIDNASDDATKRYLESLKNDDSLEVELIRNEENIGFVKAVNQGLKISNASYVCVMNNDTIPAPGWLERLIEFAETHKDVGIMNPLCGFDPNIPLEERAKILEKNKGRFMEMNQCLLFCALIKREVIDRIGYLDEAFGMGCYDDTDYSMRAGRLGYRCVSVHSSYVHHVNGISFKALGNRLALVSKGEQEYFKKWPRHLRIGVDFSLGNDTRDFEVENLLKGLLLLAREWCWINLWIFGNVDTNRKRIKYISEKIEMPLHQNIKSSFLSRNLKNIHLSVRIIERSFGTKKRKKYDIVLTNDEKAFLFLKALYPLHKTKIHVIKPESDLMRELKEMTFRIRNPNLRQPA